MMLGLILHGLGLAPDQQARVRAIMDHHHPRFQEMFIQLREANERFTNRLLATEPLKLEDLTPQINRR